MSFTTLPATEDTETTASMFLIESLVPAFLSSVSSVAGQSSPEVGA